MMTNYNNQVLYIGVTDNLARRVAEHIEGSGCQFTRKYKCHKLVYFERFSDIVQAIYREKQLKNWHRSWKENLIKNFNPDWHDLSHEVMGLE